MSRTLNALVAGAMICAVGLLAAVAQEPRKGEKPQIPGGIEGHVKSVDHEKETLSITTSDGRERTFTITEETTMLGPRGGKVRSRLKDRRFHEGMEAARRDFQEGRRVDADDHQAYRHPPVEEGQRREFRDGFREGYQQAIEHMRNDRDHDRDIPRF